MTDPASYLQWLEPGFRWLEENWTEEQTWTDVRPGFLQQLGLEESALQAPEYRVLGLIDERAVYTDATEARALLLDQGERAALVAESVTRSDAEAQAAGGGVDPQAAAADVEPQWVEGRGWMRYDATVGDWVPLDGAEGAGGGDAAATGAVDVEPQWVEGRGWMRWDAGRSEWVDVEGEQAAPGGAESADPSAAAVDVEPQWVEGRGWMRWDAGRSEWVDAEGEQAPVVEQAPAAEQASEPATGPSTEQPAVASTEQAAAASSEQAAAAATEQPAEPEPGQPAEQPDEPLVVGAADPELARQVAELPDDTATLLTEAVQEELAPVIEEAMNEIEGIDQLSPEDIQEALAAALAEVGDTAGATN